MAEPSAGVAVPLLPHIHLVSSFRFPLQQHLTIDDALKKLLDAPTIVKDQAPMTWTFVEAPPDGTVLLVWQASQLAQSQTFASDGFIWADQEMGRQISVGAFTIEAWHHQCGFIPNRETFASHARYRYRIINSSDPNISFDPQLWIIHYTMCDPNRRVPTNRIQVTQQTNQTLAMRRYLHQQGQLIRKEFMLHDRQSWPTINTPGAGMQSAGPMGGPHPGMARGPAGYYPAPHPASAAIGPSPAKRQRHVGPAHMAGGPVGQQMMMAPVARDPALEEEQDTSLGDLLDHLTPKEISLMRFRQHHEWMEEILSSPYQIDQIAPVDLGLGLRGNLQDLTKDFFEPPPENVAEDRAPGTFKSWTGNLEPEKADAFKKLVAEKIEQANAEMERMKKKQANRMAKVKRGEDIKKAEKNLRTAISDPTTSRGSEYWLTNDGMPKRNTQQQHQPPKDANAESPAPGDDTAPAATPSTETPILVEDVVASTEALVGKKIQSVRQLEQIQKGGWESPAPLPVVESPIAPQQDDIAMGNADLDGVDESHLGLPTKTTDGDLDTALTTTIDDAAGGEASPALNEAAQPVLDDDGTGLVGDDFDVSGVDVGDTDFEALMGDAAGTINSNDNNTGDDNGDIDMHNSAAGLLDQYYTSDPSTPAGGVNPNSNINPTTTTATTSAATTSMGGVQPPSSSSLQQSSAATAAAAATGIHQSNHQSSSLGAGPESHSVDAENPGGDAATLPPTA